ncbi:MAG: hypothetical protein ACXVHT_11880 [Methanobacterium sp.]
MDGPSQVKILLVEDNPADARLITDYFKNSETKIKHVSNGAEALDYLFQEAIIKMILYLILLF